MKEWFDNLEARERIFVLTGAAFTIAALAYILLWAPFDRQHRQLATRVDSWERSLQELGPLRALVASGAQTGSQNGNQGRQQAPIIIIDQTLRGRGLYPFLSRSQPTTTNGIRVELQGVAFDELVVWLGDLSDQYGMHVQSGSLSRAAQNGPGRVNANLTLERVL
ncbi:MAG: type II secretion system protein M [Gammaproteobacteria bacterium]|nr:type II secretion system protein M [Gammaproteobacteria bacterium]NNF48643.1 type II secretion system protein M [Woeseiaceae bacterium]MBT8095260.1 type II secretion system protein M [Gammaproteobacteria bacterium]MBT8105085.1 type II secretion system protein M [Gammaproteobacteria bacterium]NNK25099.1 type II secretion system protein M [Woeseiaceae bacterium]